MKYLEQEKYITILGLVLRRSQAGQTTFFDRFEIHVESEAGKESCPEDCPVFGDVT